MVCLSMPGPVTLPQSPLMDSDSVGRKTFRRRTYLKLRCVSVLLDGLFVYRLGGRFRPDVQIWIPVVGCMSLVLDGVRPIVLLCFYVVA